MTKDYTTYVNTEILPKVQKELNISNIMAAPQITKIMINVGIGSRMKVTKDYSDVVENITAIGGQKPVVIMAKKAISNFKLREGMPNGIMATLRKKQMMEFFNRMVNIAFPRIRDFQGFSEKAFDGQGNYSIGIKDCTIFPEINPEDLSHVHGMNITIVTSAKSDDEAKVLLKALNFPFKKPAKVEENAEEAPAPTAESTELAESEEAPKAAETPTE